MNFRDYPVQELQEISRQAGIASGEARRRKRAAIEREKVINAALREQHEENRRQQHENVRMIRQAARMMLQSKKALKQAR